jgi:hypothetical protein
LIHYGFPPVAFVFNLSITGFDRNGSFFLFIWAIYFTTYLGDRVFAQQGSMRLAVFDSQ